MFIILGGTGHVGSSVASSLLATGEPLTIVTRRPDKAREWEGRGAKAALADVNDTKKLREIFLGGDRLFLLNPPADPSRNAAIDEKRTLNSILEALSYSAIEKVVAESTYGARPGENIGDLSVLFHMETELERIGIPCEIIRAAYYMSNWEMALMSAKKEGAVSTFFPIDFKIPMVAPVDIGKFAAQLLVQPEMNSATHYIEGPQTYSAEDVANAFADAMDREVTAVSIPRERWVETMTELGFSDPSAKSFAAMTEVTLDDLEIAESPVRGKTTLRQFIGDLVDSETTAIPD